MVQENILISIYHYKVSGKLTFSVENTYIFVSEIWQMQLCHIYKQLIGVGRVILVKKNSIYLYNNTLQYLHFRHVYHIVVLLHLHLKI